MYGVEGEIRGGKRLQSLVLGKTLEDTAACARSARDEQESWAPWRVEILSSKRGGGAPQMLVLSLRAPLVVPLFFH